MSELVLYPKTLLVVLAEAIIERQLIKDALRAGALGYTAHDVRGASIERTPVGQERNFRDGDWEADRTIEIKFVCPQAVAHELAKKFVDTYGKNYALSLYMAEVQVLRPDKF
jgi:hypothetical protein